MLACGTSALHGSNGCHGTCRKDHTAANCYGVMNLLSIFLIKIHGGEGAEQSVDGSWLELSAKFNFHVLSEHFAQWMKSVWASVFTVHLECSIAFSYMLKSHEHSEPFT